MRTRLGILYALAVVSVISAFAATPPGAMNYQGVLRDSLDRPLTGMYDMVFRFHGAEAGGDEILIDRHTLATSNAVIVTGGLFNVDLGTGTVSDGAGPGTYSLLSDVFANYANVYLSIQIGTETLSPRTRILAAGYALNAHTIDGKLSTAFANSAHSHAGSDVTSMVSNSDLLDGVHSGAFAPAVHLHSGSDVTSIVFNADMVDNLHAASFLDTSATPQTKASTLTITASAGRGISAQGPDAGGYFKDSNGSGYAYVGYVDEGISAHGNTQGGYFQDDNSSGRAHLAWGDRGIQAEGNEAGAYIGDSNSSGFSWIGWGDRGIHAEGNELGGYFKDRDHTGTAWVGHGDHGISAQGTEAGGHFEDSNNTGDAWLAIGDRGISASGSELGGFFKDIDSTGAAWVAIGDRGISAEGNELGGFFKDLDQTGAAWVADGNWGIAAQGDAGGGWFESTYFGTGVYGYSRQVPGYFEHWLGNVTQVADGITKVSGNGVPTFLQNHPYDPTKTIRYASLEGDEVAVFTRGRARLKEGEARVKLGETFAWVTNPDIGLTAQVTPRGPCAGLYVSSLSTSELVVKEIGGRSSSAEFDFVVFGLRIGFEEATVVRERERAYPIPSMLREREMLEKDSALRRFVALDRYEGMNRDFGLASGGADLARAASLRAAVHEFVPDVDRSEPPPGAPKHLTRIGGAVEDATASADARPAGRRPDRDPDAPSATPSRAEDRSSAAPAPSGGATILMPVAETVEIGDVLVADPSSRGRLLRGRTVSDPLVVGIVAGDPVVLGGELQAPVAGAGFAVLKVDATHGAVAVGDLLTTSETAGHARKASDATPGRIIAKALEPLESGTGLIRVLVMPR